MEIETAGNGPSHYRDVKEESYTKCKEMNALQSRNKGDKWEGEDRGKVSEAKMKR